MKKPLLGLAVLVALIGAGEWGARKFCGRPADAALFEPTGFENGLPTGWTPSVLHRADPQLVWVNIPNLAVEHQGVTVETNEFGLRGPQTTRKKPPGVFRILSLGESSSFGWRIPQDKTYAAILERVLNHDHPDQRFEVLNAGVVGWSMAQSIVYLENEGLDFEPDAVLLYQGFNDFLESNYLAHRAGGIPDADVVIDSGDLALLGRPLRTSQRMAEALRRRSVLFHCLQQAWSKPVPRPPETRPEAGAADRGPIRVPDPDRLLLLGRFRDLAHEHNFDPILLIPAYRDFSDHRELLVEFGREGGVHTIDLEEVISQGDRPRGLLFLDPAHPNQRFHRSIALRIAEYFE